MGTFAKSRLETRIMTGPILGAVGIKTRREGIETRQRERITFFPASELKPAERVLRQPATPPVRTT